MITEHDAPEENPHFEYYNYPIKLNVKEPSVTDMVKEFAEIMGQAPNPQLYERLISEEFDEWRKEVSDPHNELKELSDLVYVCYGYAKSMGWNLDEAIRRVHKNNIGRCLQKDGTIRRREDGKILKNPDYPKVDLRDLM